LFRISVQEPNLSATSSNHKQRKTTKNNQETAITQRKTAIHTAKTAKTTKNNETTQRKQLKQPIQKRQSRVAASVRSGLATF